MAGGPLEYLLVMRLSKGERQGRAMVKQRPSPVYLEVGSRRVFAGALDWPGWCRSGRDEDTALRALVAYGPRYAAAIGRLAHELTAPTDTSALDVVERLEGNATTDFGAPSIAPAADERPLDGSGARTPPRRCSRRAGPRSTRPPKLPPPRCSGKAREEAGGTWSAIVSHVLEADRAYLSLLWSAYRKTG